MQTIVKVVLVSIIIFTILLGEYFIFIKGPEYAKPKGGTVVSVYESKGIYSTMFAFVRFDNGDSQEVNTGHTVYKPNERFTSTLSWDPIMGISGLAYGWSPENYPLALVE